MASHVLPGAATTRRAERFGHLALARNGGQFAASVRFVTVGGL